MRSRSRPTRARDPSPGHRPGPFRWQDTARHCPFAEAPASGSRAPCPRSTGRAKPFRTGVDHPVFPSAPPGSRRNPAGPRSMPLPAPPDRNRSPAPVCRCRPEEHAQGASRGATPPQPWGSGCSAPARHHASWRCRYCSRCIPGFRPPAPRESCWAETGRRSRAARHRSGPARHGAPAKPWCREM